MPELFKSEGKNFIKYQDLDIIIPEFLGEIRDFHETEKFLVVKSDYGKASFHIEGPLKGKMHWHSIRKNFKQHILIDEVKKRLDFHITHFHWGNNAKSAIGAYGRIDFDKTPIIEFNSQTKISVENFGASLANYISMSPSEIANSDKRLIKTLFLVDKRNKNQNSDQFINEISQIQ